MSPKTNNNNSETLTDAVVNRVQQAGLAFMAAAALIGSVELGDHSRSAKNAILPMQPVLAAVGDRTDLNPLRREREEVGPHYVSYSVTQRTPGRSSKI